MDFLILKSLMFVGGIPDHSRGLGDNDRSTLLQCVEILRRLGVPLNGGFHVFKEHGDPLDFGDDLSIVNIDPKYGGRDFLKEDGRSDVVILGNIAHAESRDDYQDRLNRDRVLGKNLIRGVWG